MEKRAQRKIKIPANILDKFCEKVRLTIIFKDYYLNLTLERVLVQEMLNFQYSHEN